MPLKKRGKVKKTVTARNDLRQNETEREELGMTRGSGLAAVEANAKAQANEVARIVAQQLLTAIPDIVAQITASINANNYNTDNHRNANQGIPTVHLRGCDYITFTKCKPKEFHGTEGAVGLIMWLESIEAVLHISRCAEEHKVEYASSQFQGDALSWWNGEIRSRGLEPAYCIPWTEFKRLLMEKYCPREEVQRMEAEFWSHAMVGLDNEQYTTRFHEFARLVPHMVDTEEKLVERYIYGVVPEIRRLVIASNPTTLQAAISATNRMVIDWKRSGDFPKTTDGSKRKTEGSSRNEKGGNGENC